MSKKIIVLRFLVVILIIAFAIYEEIFIIKGLIGFDPNSGTSYSTLIIGAILFGLIFLVGVCVLIYLIIKEKQKRYYILKK